MVAFSIAVTTTAKIFMAIATGAVKKAPLPVIAAGGSPPAIMVLVVPNSDRCQ